MKYQILNILKYFLPLLLIYAAVSKLMVFDIFLMQLGQSPLIPEGLIKVTGYGLIAAEFIIAAFFFFDKTTELGLVLATGIMFLFSLYLISLVSFFTNVPCSCGGILGKMSYPTHIIFNLCCTALGILCIIKAKPHAENL